MKLNKFIIITATSILLSACGDKVYDVDYYSSHLDEAQEVAKKCASGDMTGDNCTNAKTAISKNSQKAWMEKYGSK